ncbi:M28 family metallopeptidase [Nocardioides pacificus]
MGISAPRTATGCALALVLLATGIGCSEDDDARPGTPPPSSSSPSSPSSAPTGSPSGTASATPTPTPDQAPARFEADRALAHVRALAGRIGPRLATGPGFRRAAAYVEERFAAHGYDVRRQGFGVPAGDSWGVPVAAGRSFNVVATPPGFDPAAPYVVVGAHLDTVAVAPGAEDNASGVALLLELARLAAAEETRLPAVLVAFGAEEPRGPGDDQHHFGSQHYVREMGRAERKGLRAMVSLDRIGVGARVPVGLGGLSPTRVRDELLALARRLRIPTTRTELTTSDHWSFEKAGFTVARLGSTSYEAYHSERDVPAVVERAQLDRGGRLIWAWLRGR